jgi:uncharacterized repeat protein (TIGR03803 family)
LTPGTLPWDVRSSWFNTQGVFTARSAKEYLLMRSKLSFSMIVVLAVVTLTTLMSGTRAAAQEETVLYSFSDNGTDGQYPDGDLVFDASGNLYGTTSLGVHGCAQGQPGCGTVFELAPRADGGWTENVLHTFKGGSNDGYDPHAGMTFDAFGNLYGTTQLGGAYAEGTVFQLASVSGGIWTETILHSFGNGTDGRQPLAALIFDASGNLYGTTASGGSNVTDGTVFELTSKGGGKWAESVVHSFDAFNGQGWSPYGGLTLDASGNLYGTTSFGGDACCYGNGTVFELELAATGRFTEKILHKFGPGGSRDGSGPYAGLVSDASGNLYGTTLGGGGDTYSGYGTVFELKRTGVDRFADKTNILHDFDNNRMDGGYPWAGVVVDASGNLYGTTSIGGAYGCGTVFELKRTATGRFAEKTLHHFKNDTVDGCGPHTGLIFDASGNLYGTTLKGGAFGYGTVFEITP